jgi:cytosine deaminase
VKPYIDLQLVAFPQDGYYRFPGAVQLLEEALRRGVDVVGGIPHFERTRADGDLSVRALCELAARHGLRVDLHCDETDDPTSRHVETLAAETIRLGLQGRVTGSHLTSMHGMDNYYASKLIDLMAEAQLTVVSNPLISITMQGRHDPFPKRRGMARVEALMARGVNCALGQDCCMDPWYALGSADMLEVAHMGLHVAQLTSLEGMATCFACVTDRAAGVFGLESYGIAPGRNADLVVLQAGDPIEAMQFRAARLLVIRRGAVIAETPAAEPRLHLPGRPAGVRFERPPHGRA